MSQYSLKNALLIAFLSTSTIISFQTHAQQEACQNVELALDVNGQLTLSPEAILVPNVINEDNRYSFDREFFDCSDIGAHTVMVSIVYANGQVGSCQSIVKVADTTPPRLLEIPDAFVYLSKEGTASPVMTSLIDIKEACSAISDLDLYFSQTTFSTEDLGGSVDMKIIASDASGNEAEKQFTVKVIPYQEGSGYIVRPDLNFEMLESSFEFYPNPATSVITIDANGSPLGMITVLNSTGKEVLQIESEELKTQIDIEELPAGMYFIECNSKVKRFVKK